MVIGKDRKRITALESEIVDLKKQITILTNKAELFDENDKAYTDAFVKVDEVITIHEQQLKDLLLTVENAVDNGEVKKSPQQLLREWLTGEDGNE